jgi:hypothetical protein
MQLPHELGDGLRLRRSTRADVESLAAFNAGIHSDAGADLPNDRIADWVRDLLGGAHPTFGEGDFTLVEEVASGRIVSSLNTISQTWAYAGLPFKVGRPELVGTLPEYRRRGLVRLQMDLVHAWSAERGELVQAITGIPWYYRQFGYEMTVSLGGARLGYDLHVPTLKDGESEPYAVRAATVADLAFIAELDAQAHTARDLLRCVRDAAVWRYEVLGRSPRNANARAWAVIESAAGVRVGYLAHPLFLWDDQLVATGYELSPGVSWLAVTPSVIRYLWCKGQAYAQAENKPIKAWGFGLGGDHPAYHAARDRLPREWQPYAWYLRVPDLVAFLTHLKPVLEDRLAASIAAGHTGEIFLSQYRSGLQLKFEQGKIGVEAWKPGPGLHTDCAFPEQTFLHLLFGQRTIDEIRHLYRDCWVDGDTTRVVLEALFPKQASDIWPIN